MSSTTQLPPAPGGTTETPVPKAGWSRTRKLVVGGIGAFVALSALSAALSGGKTTTPAPAAAPAPASAVAPAAPSAAAPAPEQTQALAPVEPQYTVSQEQAIESAESYLDMGGFSEAGLIDQLSSKYGEGFSKADAAFAVAHVKVNWNEQAVISAKSYLDMGGFSRNGLIDQLESSYGEGFTHAQAVYAVNAVGL